MFNFCYPSQFNFNPFMNFFMPYNMQPINYYNPFMMPNYSIFSPYYARTRNVTRTERPARVSSGYKIVSPKHDKTYNKAIGKKLAQKVVANLPNDRDPEHPLCAKYVKEAVEDCGLGEYIKGNGAHCKYVFRANPNFKEILEECAYEVALECQDDKDLKGELLSERVLSKSTMPMSVKYVEKKPGMDVMVTPSFMARAEYAYGSTEIERKENKDRKYNQPLIMTIKFKERFSDGKYSDNELTAVIGILGKVIRIPSEEMEYVLSEAAQGNTIDGIFKTADLGDTVSDMLSSSKISRQLKNLPQSADVWHNLEKVATLAAANKLSGKRSGNVANAHIVFSQKEIDSVRNETGVDFVKDTKKAVALMKKYSAFTLMVANDPGQRVCILDDQDNISWNVVPYNALMGKDTGDQLIAALSKMGRMG